MRSRCCRSPASLPKAAPEPAPPGPLAGMHGTSCPGGVLLRNAANPVRKDRKSTRLNSSHLGISYAVFCLMPRPPISTLFPYTTLFRSLERLDVVGVDVAGLDALALLQVARVVAEGRPRAGAPRAARRDARHQLPRGSPSTKCRESGEK